MTKKIIIIISSGFLMGFANAPIAAWYLAWIGLVPLWVMLILPEYQSLLKTIEINKTPKNSYKIIDFVRKKCQFIWQEKFLFPLLWGISFYGFSLFWITGIHPLTWMGIPWLFSLFITICCWIFITLWATIIVIIWSWLLTKVNQLKSKQVSPDNLLIIQSIKRIIIGVSAWCLLEMIWSHTPLWWPTLSLTQSPHNLIILQLGKLSGTTTITALIVAVNGLIAEGLIHFLIWKKDKSNFLKSTHQYLWLTCFFLLVICYNIGLYLYHIPSDKFDQASIKIGLIQGNIPHQIKSLSSGFFEALQGYTKGYKLLVKQEAQLVLTPETALPFFWDDIPFYSSLYEEVLNLKVPVVTGAFSRSKRGYTNSLFAITSTGKVLSQYDKIKLVPLGEYIPFQWLLGKLIKRLSAFDIVLIKGDEKQIFKTFNTPVGKAIIGICYESVFPNNFRFQTLAGGEFILTASNNSFYHKGMLFQHHAQDVLRAIENDRWVARATNTGLSAIINPQGKTLWLSQINTYEIHLDTIYQRETKTLYVLFGDWLIWVLLMMTLILIFMI